jgi:hypothetical protein
MERKDTMKLRTKLNILASIFLLVRSMRTMTKGLRSTSPVLIATTSALVTATAFMVAPRINEEIKARRVLS